MKRITLLLPFLLILQSFNLLGETISVTTTEGTKLEGELMNREDILEWRRDIYEIRNSDGRTERFFLNPKQTGRIRLSDIREIRRIQPSAAPEDIVTLSNDQKARLLLKYLLIMQNGRNFYISDFITLEHYFLEVRTSDGSSRIYLSKLQSMLQRTESQEPQIQEVKIKHEQKTELPETLPEMNPVTYRTQFEFIAEKPATRGILAFFIVLSIILAGVIITAIMLRTKRHKKPTRKKAPKAKKIRSLRKKRKVSRTKKRKS